MNTILRINLDSVVFSYIIVLSRKIISVNLILCNWKNHLVIYLKNINAL